VCCLLSLATAGSLLSSARAMPSDASGVLAPEVKALAEFYDCTVPGDDVMYSTLAVCTPACYAGDCVQKSAMGKFSTPEQVMLHPNTAHAREVVLVTLSPVIQVGDTVRMLIKAVDMAITVAVQEDPGLPIGMTSQLNAAKSELTVVWTPRVGQEGYVHELFVVGMSGGNYSKDLGIRIAVAAGALAWQQPMAAESHHSIIVGQTKSADLICVSNYPLDIVVAKDSKLPAAMSLHVTNTPRMLNADFSFAPLLPLHATVAYVAKPGTEGTSASACFTCHSPLVPISENRCVTFKIEACKYVTKPSDSLYSLTRMFHSSNNWRRLLNLNPMLTPDPKALMGDGQVVLTGSVYTILAGDSLSAIGGRLSTTVKGLLELNPSLHSEAAVLQVGQQLCVAACTAQPNPTFDSKEAA